MISWLKKNYSKLKEMTLHETNIAPEKPCLEDEVFFWDDGMAYFQGLCEFYGG